MASNHGRDRSPKHLQRVGKSHPSVKCLRSRPAMPRRGAGSPKGLPRTISNRFLIGGWVMACSQCCGITPSSITRPKCWNPSGAFEECGFPHRPFGAWSTCCSPLWRVPGSVPAGRRPFDANWNGGAGVRIGPVGLDVSEHISIGLLYWFVSSPLLPHCAMAGGAESLDSSLPRRGFFRTSRGSGHVHRTFVFGVPATWWASDFPHAP